MVLKRPKIVFNSSGFQKVIYLSMGCFCLIQLIVQSKFIQFLILPFHQSSHLICIATISFIQYKVNNKLLWFTLLISWIIGALYSIYWWVLLNILIDAYKDYGPLQSVDSKQFIKLGFIIFFWVVVIWLLWKIKPKTKRGSMHG